MSRTKLGLLFAIATLIMVAMPFRALAANSQIRVAVIDTGIDSDAVNNLCKMGHRSFVDESPLVDTHGHGTHIAGLIESNAKLSSDKYCVISLKYYKPNTKETVAVSAMIAAIREAVRLKVDFINISGGGKEPNSEERQLIISALNMGIRVIAAAGNEHEDLGDSCNYFPACYDRRIVVVGNLTKYNTRAPSSNYGTYVNTWEVGTNVISTLPGYKRKGEMTGTSQATAIVTGKMLNRYLHK